MTNPSGSPGAGPAGSEPTQPFWVGRDPSTAGSAAGGPADFAAGGPADFAAGGPADSAAGGAASLGPAASQAASFGAPPGTGRGKAFHWTLGIVAAALLAGGGASAGLSLAGHSAPGAVPGQASPADATQQAALLNSTLNSADSPGTLTTAFGATVLGAGQPAPGGAKAGAAARGANGPLCARARRVARAAGKSGLPRLARRIQAGAERCRLVRRRVFAFFLLRGVDGQFTIQTEQGTKTLAYTRGVIQSVDAGKSLVVKAADGTTWTWDLVSTTVVRDQQGKVSQSTLAAGVPVWAGGPVIQGAKDARLIVLRPPQPATAFPSPSPGS